MQKKFALLVSFFLQFLTLSAFGQSNEPLAKSLLWRISGKGLERPSYIFGTIHAICSEDYFFTNPMKSAFKESNQLILEVNLSDQSTMSQLEESMHLPAGKMLKDYFDDEEEYRNFAQSLKENADIDIESFATYKPFVLISALSMKAFTCSITTAYETVLSDQAKERKLSINGLETMLSQVQIFDKMKNADIKNMLVAGYTDMKSDDKQQEEMIRMYKQQDIEGLNKLILQSKEIKGQEDALLFNRNRDWAEKLPRMITDKQSFIAVGAGHLAGEKGLLQLMRKQGYTIEPVL